MKKYIGWGPEMSWAKELLSLDVFTNPEAPQPLLFSFFFVGVPYVGMSDCKLLAIGDLNLISAPLSGGQDMGPKVAAF